MIPYSSYAKLNKILPSPQPSDFNIGSPSSLSGTFRKVSEAFQLPPPLVSPHDLSEEQKISQSILFPLKRKNSLSPIPDSPFANTIGIELERLKETILAQNSREIKRTASCSSVQLGDNFRLSPLLCPQIQTPPTTKSPMTSETITKNSFRCSAEERLKKICKYKEKLRKRRMSHKLSRDFDGRKKVAIKKLRVNGRFVKCKGVTACDDKQ